MASPDDLITSRLFNCCMTDINSVNAVIREQGRIRAKVVELGIITKRIHSTVEGRPPYREEIWVRRSDVLAILNPNECAAVRNKDTYHVEKAHLDVLSSDPLSILSDHAAKCNENRAKHLDTIAMRVWNVPTFIKKHPKLLKLWARFNHLAIEMQREHAEPVTTYRFKKRGVVVGMTKIRDY